MMKLRELLAKANLERVPEHWALDLEVTKVCTNSHACHGGELFIGMPGTRVDGGEFWQSAVNSGAIAAIVTPQAAAKQPPTENTCVIQSDNMEVICSAIAAAFYDYPAAKLNMVGITGTNGKTTTSHLVEYFLNQTQFWCMHC